MKLELIGLTIFSMLLFSISPAFADVKSVDLEKPVFTDEESIVFVGKESTGKQSVFVIIRSSSGETEMVSDPLSDDDGTFKTFPRSVDAIFSRSGIYEATAFTGNEKVEDGLTIKLEYDGNKVFLVPDVVLTLQSISDRTIEVEKTVTFTAGITDNSIKDVVFSLKNEPSGAVIDPDSGKFTWTPSSSHGNIQDVHYTFDVIATSGSQEDVEKITITVKKAFEQPTTPATSKPEPTTPKQPEPLQIPAPFVDQTKDPQSYVDRYQNEATYKEWFDDNFPEYDSIYQAVGLEEPLQIPAPFVDQTKDPQSYVDRYQNEATYKEWFDDNFPEYDSIYQAVGLEKPKELAPFVDPNQDPQYYIDRYEKEITYKEWFDKTYPDITIYEAVGLDDPSEESPITDVEEFGECGEGTTLVNGMCVIVESQNGGGCLIATAAYGSEMAPQIQSLREIRDNQLMTTQSGAFFMTGFNQIYYIFSPTIADIQRENPTFKEITKLVITPMLFSLSIMSAAESENEILGYGISVILMNLGMYVVAPAIMIYQSKKFIKL